MVFLSGVSGSHSPWLWLWICLTVLAYVYNFAVFGHADDVADYTLLNRLLGELTYSVDVSDVDVINVDIHVATISIRLPGSVTCSDFQVESLNVGRSNEAEYVESEGLERFNITFAARGIGFRCLTHLCIKTSLPFNSWDCGGTVSFTSSESKGVQVNVERMIYAKNFTNSIPFRTEATDIPCADKVNMDNVVFTGHNLKHILGVDITPFVTSALMGSEKETALGPIRTAICSQLDKASDWIGMMTVNNSFSRFYNESKSNSFDPLRLEKDLYANISEDLPLFDISNNLLTRFILPVKKDNETGKRTVDLPADNPALKAVFSALNISEDLSDKGMAGILPDLFEAVVGSKIPVINGAYDVIEALKSAVGEDRAKQYQHLEIEVPDIGTFTVDVKGALISYLPMKPKDTDRIASYSFNLIGKQTLGLPKVEIESLTLVIDASIKASVRTSMLLNQVLEFSIDEDFSAKLKVLDGKVDLTTLLAVNEEKIATIQMGSLLQKISSCILSAFFVDPKVANFVLSADYLKFGFRGFRDGIFVIGQNIVEVFEALYMSSLPLVLQAYFYRDLIGESILDSETATCPVVENKNPDAMHNVDDSFLAKFVANGITLDSVNDVVEKNLAGGLVAPISLTELLVVEIPGLEVGVFHPQQLVLSLDLLKASLQRVDDISLLKTIEKHPQKLRNGLGLEKLKISGRFHIDLFPPNSDAAARRVLRKQYQEHPNKIDFLSPGQLNSFDVGVTLEKFQAALNVLVSLSEYSVENIMLNESFAIDCWLGRFMPFGGRHNLTISVNKPEFLSMCISCDSIMMKRAISLLSDKRTGEYLLSCVGNIIEKWIHAVHDSFEQELWQITVAAGKKRCEGGDLSGYFSNSIPDPGDIGQLEVDASSAQLLLAGICVIFVVSGFFVSWQSLYKSRPPRGKLDALSIVPESHETPLLPEYQPEVSEATILSDQLYSDENIGVQILAMAPLWRNQNIPLVARALVPIIVCVNIALFVYGHIGPAITFSAYAKLVGGDLNFEDINEFSVVSSMTGLWNGGATYLALIICLFSIIWPYLKLVILAFCWFAPVSLLGVENRGRLLNLVDMIGKWSLIDLFVISFVIAFLSIHIQSPDALFSTAQTHMYDFELAVLTKSNLFTFMIALIMSLVVTSVVTAYNDQMLDRLALANSNPLGEERVTLIDALFEHESFNNFESNESSPYGLQYQVAKYLIPGCVLASIILMFVALSVPILRVEYLGLLGKSMQLGGEDPVRELSALEFIADSFNGGAPSSQILLGVVISFVIFLIPVAQQVFLFWVVCPSFKFTLTQALHIRLLNQILCSFCAVEVFIIGASLSVLELGGFTRQLLSDHCGALERLSHSLLYPLGMIDQKNAQAGCFELTAQILKQSIGVFFACTLLSNLVNFCIGHYAIDKLILFHLSRDGGRYNRLLENLLSNGLNSEMVAEDESDELASENSQDQLEYESGDGIRSLAGVERTTSSESFHIELT